MSAHGAIGAKVTLRPSRSRATIFTPSVAVPLPTIAGVFAAHGRRRRRRRRRADGRPVSACDRAGSDDGGAATASPARPVDARVARSVGKARVVGASRLHRRRRRRGGGQRRRRRRRHGRRRWARHIRTANRAGSDEGGDVQSTHAGDARVARICPRASRRATVGRDLPQKTRWCVRDAPGSQPLQSPQPPAKERIGRTTRMPSEMHRSALFKVPCAVESRVCRAHIRCRCKMGRRRSPWRLHAGSRARRRGRSEAGAFLC